jgi:hypothetical protein
LKNHEDQIVRVKLQLLLIYSIKNSQKQGGCKMKYSGVDVYECAHMKGYEIAGAAEATPERTSCPSYSLFVNKTAGKGIRDSGRQGEQTRD